MDPNQGCGSFLVAWRGQNFVIEMNLGATLKDFGVRLQDLTNAKPDTIRLLVPVEKSSKLLCPFSDEHANLNLESALVLKGKPIRMMGVPEEELEKVIRYENIDHRIAGFGEEERRLKQRSSYQPYLSVKLPKGTYIFCDFRTLSLPGIELIPPASKAMELLHKLASDPGIAAIMNKYRWRVGILTEMAPVGYVGVSPKCVLGFNKNHGEEISLRLRTDDLKGFRKYESIKKTLLHELAHMVHSEHDQNFYALDKQLNREATTLDWTKSRSRILSRLTPAESHEGELDVASYLTSAQKLGGQTSNLSDARSASASAALLRFSNKSPSQLRFSEVPSPTSSYINVSQPETNYRPGNEYTAVTEGIISGDTTAPENESEVYHFRGEQSQRSVCPEQLNSPIATNLEPSPQADASGSEWSESRTGGLHSQAIPRSQASVPDQSNSELQVVQDPVVIFCRRLETSIQMLKDEVKPSEAQLVLQTLIKIIRNVVENPYEVKFKRLRKGNPTIQRNIIAYKGALDILSLIGFFEDIIIDEGGKADVFLTLKRDDPGLLWLAKSSLEAHTA